MPEAINAERKQQIEALRTRTEAIVNFNLNKTKGPVKIEQRGKTPITEFKKNNPNTVDTVNAALIPLTQQMLDQKTFDTFVQQGLITKEVREGSDHYSLTNEGKITAIEHILKAIEDNGVENYSNVANAVMQDLGVDTFMDTTFITGLQVVAVEAAEEIQTAIAKGETVQTVTERKRYVANATGRRKMSVSFHYEGNKLVLDPNLGGIQKIDKSAKVAIGGNEYTYDQLSGSLLGKTNKGHEAFSQSAEDLLNAIPVTDDMVKRLKLYMQLNESTLTGELTEQLDNPQQRDQAFRALTKAIIAGTPYDDTLTQNFEDLQKLARNTTMDPKEKEIKMAQLREPVALRIADWGKIMFGTESKLEESVMIDLRGAQAIFNIAVPPEERLKLFKLEHEKSKTTNKDEIEKINAALTRQTQEIRRAILAANNVVDRNGKTYPETELSQKIATRMGKLKAKNWETLNDEAQQEMIEAIKKDSDYMSMPQEERVKFEQEVNLSYKNTRTALEKLKSKRGYRSEIVDANMNSIRIAMALKGTGFLLNRSLSQEVIDRTEGPKIVGPINKTKLPKDVWEYGLRELEPVDNTAITGAPDLESLLAKLQQASVSPQAEPKIEMPQDTINPDALLVAEDDGKLLDNQQSRDIKTQPTDTILRVVGSDDIAARTAQAGHANILSELRENKELIKAALEKPQSTQASLQVAGELVDHTDEVRREQIEKKKQLEEWRERVRRESAGTTTPSGPQIDLHDQTDSTVLESQNVVRIPDVSDDTKIQNIKTNILSADPQNVRPEDFDTVKNLPSREAFETQIQELAVMLNREGKPPHETLLAYNELCDSLIRDLQEHAGWSTDEAFKISNLDTVTGIVNNLLRQKLDEIKTKQPPGLQEETPATSKPDVVIAQTETSITQVEPIESLRTEYFNTPNSLVHIHQVVNNGSVSLLDNGHAVVQNYANTNQNPDTATFLSGNSSLHIEGLTHGVIQLNGSIRGNATLYVNYGETTGENPPTVIAQNPAYNFVIYPPHTREENHIRVTNQDGKIIPNSSLHYELEKQIPQEPGPDAETEITITAMNNESKLVNVHLKLVELQKDDGSLVREYVVWGAEPVVSQAQQVIESPAQPAQPVLSTPGVEDVTNPNTAGSESNEQPAVAEAALILAPDQAKGIAEFIYDHLFSKQVAQQLPELQIQAQDIIGKKNITQQDLIALAQNPRSITRLLGRAVAHQVLGKLEEVLPDESATIVQESMATMHKWDEELRKEGSEIPAWMMQLTQIQAEGADVIAHLLDIPLNQLDFLPSNLATRLFALLADRPAGLDHIDNFLLRHVAFLPKKKEELTTPVTVPEQKSEQTVTDFNPGDI